MRVGRAHRTGSETLAASLTSNGRPIRFDHSHFAPMRDSTALLDHPDLLRERYRDEGYLMLRGVLDPEVVLQIRAAYFSLFSADYFKPGTDPVDGVFSGRVPEELPAYGVEGHPAHSFVRSESFLAFTAEPALERLAEAVLGCPAGLVPRRVLRHFDGASRRASRAHVDRAYPCSDAVEEFVTLWIPLGDCSLETGGLLYLADSHRLDVAAVESTERITDRPHDHRPFSHDLAWTARTLSSRWLWADFRAGDVAVHCPDLVHASLDNTSEIMRLSVDMRFQPARVPVRPAWSQPWSADDGE